MQFCWISRGGGSNRQPQRAEPCQCVSGQPRACHGALQEQCSLYSVQQEWWGLHWGLQQGWTGGSWGLRFCPFVEISRGGGSSATTALRGLPVVCEWPALGMPRGTARSNAISAVCSMCGCGCTGGCGWLGRWFVGGCGFASHLWRFPEEEAALSNHSAQSPTSLWVAGSGHAMGHYKVT